MRVEAHLFDDEVGWQAFGASREDDWCEHVEICFLDGVNTAAAAGRRRQRMAQDRGDARAARQFERWLPAVIQLNYHNHLASLHDDISGSASNTAQPSKRRKRLLPLTRPISPRHTSQHLKSSLTKAPTTPSPLLAPPPDCRRRPPARSCICVTSSGSSPADNHLLLEALVHELRLTRHPSTTSHPTPARRTITREHFTDCLTRDLTDAPRKPERH